MKKDEFKFRFDSPQAEADAQALADLLAKEFPDWPAQGSRRLSPSAPATLP